MVLESLSVLFSGVKFEDLDGALSSTGEEMATV